MIRAFLRSFPELDAHHRFFLSIVAALAALAIGWLVGQGWPTWLLTGWDAFAFASLALAWWRIVRATPAEAVRSSKLDDSSYAAIFMLVVLGACASLLGAGYLLSAAKDLGSAAKAARAALAVGTVIGSWALIHTAFTLRYAHLFYRIDDDEDEKKTEGSGLDFPNEKWPDYLDFAYFSFVIGMTSQVSDVQISSREHRRLALVHGMLSFVFNTVILALSINLAASLV